MLALSNINLRRGPKVLIESASFQVHAGQRIGVIGPNGCGKSSLFAMLLVLAMFRAAQSQPETIS